MKLTDRKWKKYTIGDVFTIMNGKGITKTEISEHPGELATVQSGEANNGLMGYIDKDYCFEKSYVFYEGPCLTVARSGSSGYISYQEKGCCVGDSAKILVLKSDKNATRNVLLFLKTILMANKYRYMYARKVTEENYLSEIIELPINSKGKIDFGFIEKYTNSLNATLTDVPNYFLDKGYEKACWYMDNVEQDKFEAEYAKSQNNNKINLTDRKWKNFKLSSIVPNIHNGKSYNASDLVNAPEGDDFVSYVTRTDENNGVSMYAQSKEYAGLEEGGAITIGDTTSTIFYQSSRFITGPHIIVLRADWFNIYTANFLITLLNMEKYRYPVFGRAFSKDLIGKTVIPLPVDKEGNPDYSFMEEYIKSRPFSCNL